MTIDVKLNKGSSRTANFFFNVADKKVVEQTRNHFYTKAEFEQKHLDRNLVERIEVNCFRD